VHYCLLSERTQVVSHPIGQALSLKEIDSYVNYPPMQDPASYNLEQVMQRSRA
jgi:hypothetical protein